MINSLDEWFLSVTGPQWFLFVKILSGNDTLLNDTHQAGPYVPKPAFFRIFPGIAKSTQPNPRDRFDVSVDSHGQQCVATAIWYNSATRNEARITGWGGKESVLLDPNSTGSICIFAFERGTATDVSQCRVWLCEDIEDSDEARARYPELEPGRSVFADPMSADVLRFPSPHRATCRLTSAEIPDEWRYVFPSPSEILGATVSRKPLRLFKDADKRLIARRECEFELFLSIENLLVLPRIQEGFATVDVFVEYANAITNRRKSRSGRSLELHAREIFDEEGVKYEHGGTTEGKRTPDFLFPSAAAYSIAPPESVRMLGSKTTVKDRWRQILDEAARLPVKHLLTLQHGVSQDQFQQMTESGIKLVVPSPLHSKYHPSIRPQLMSFSQFIAEVSALPKPS